MKMKKNKIINKISGSTKRKFFTLLVLLITVVMIYAQAHPGTEEGLPTPIDGGILMAILAGGGLISMLFKKNKKNKE